MVDPCSNHTMQDAWRARVASRLATFSDGNLTAIGLVAAFVVFGVAIALRDPTLFTNPQFWAEDGNLLYAQAYNLGWFRALFIPHAGYLVFAQRIGAALALLVSFRWAPLVMAIWGLLFQALPIPILLSSRCKRWGSLTLRSLFLAAYVGIPNVREIHVSCTDAQWHIGLAALMIALAAPPSSSSGRIFDITLLICAALSGPFGLLLLPFVAIFWWIRRQRWSLLVLSMLTIFGALQMLVMLHHHGERYASVLGATPGRFAQFLGGDVYLGLFASGPTLGAIHRVVYSIAAMILGLGLCALCFRYASAEVRLFIAYCFTVVAATMRWPVAARTTVPLWLVVLWQPDNRYFFYPALPLLLAVIWCAVSGPQRVIRAIGIALSAALFIRACQGFRYPPLPDLNFARQAEALKSAPAGAGVTILINPVGWYMELVKR